ncbi:MAG: hypothetical protein RL272_277 [Candidatus Parcubacteria bacterium]|jgi:isopentenyldiphosphate isomerase
MEMLQIVHPETGADTGEIMPRADAIARGAWCRSTNVFVLNPQGEVLCHKRSAGKERLPGVWSTHLGGHVAVGETYEANARKELAEESGIDPGAAPLLPWRTTRIDGARLWAREFVTLCGSDAGALAPQPGEVDEFRWMPPDLILRLAAVDPEGWCAGTHDFRTEYWCMRSVLTSAGATGAMAVPKKLEIWHPGFLVPNTGFAG